ncbi:proline dehydrogenase [Coemansia guatemalensis]|uniref:Proline dehydrogenase n=1 Tax=Coemansia guatemalensis TaxID=2761395 RepID=A0A9W8HYR1_9FUNG|nr:proline dehydrogenase [Coemansia guatemalensis]
MPISASPAVTAVNRLITIQQHALRPVVAAYARPTRLSFIHSRAATPAAGHALAAVATPLTARGLATSPAIRTRLQTPSDSAAAAPVAEHAAADNAGAQLRPDASLALAHQSLGKLVTGWFVYRACGNAGLVQMAPRLLQAFARLRLAWASNAVVRRTFFAWFCAGENEREIVHTMRQLKEAGIGSILDFSAEADLPAGETEGAAARAHANVKADAFAKEYFHGLHMASQVSQAFAAVKITGLVDPAVLYRLSAVQSALQKAFAVADTDGDGCVDFAQFRDGVLAAMPGGGRVASPSGLFAMVDRDGDGQVDWIDVQMALGMDNPLARPLYLREGEGLGAVESDVEDYERLVARARAVVQQAATKGVRLMVDAEHSYFQPMIDHVTQILQREFNGSSSGTLVFNTYQMYCVDSLQRLHSDVERAAREGWRFAAKLVRGAYMELERARAQEHGYESPINPTLSATHAMYNDGVRFLLQRIAGAQAAGQVPPALFVATHNRESIGRALGLVRDLHIDTTAEPVMFGQLLGMQDATSYALARDKLPIYKYVPYGPLDEVMPYLVRRAQENSAVAGAIREEAASVMAEIRRRLLRRPLPMQAAAASEAVGTSQ